MKNILPVCPLIEGNSDNGNSEETWKEGLASLLEDLKFNEELPFRDPAEIWEEVCYILEEEDMELTESLKNALRKIFDQLWPVYKS